MAFITPDSSYVFSLYTDLNLISPIKSSIFFTPSVDTVSVTSLVSRLSNDLTSLSETALDEIQSSLRDVFTTGDLVTLPTGQYVFVEDAGTVENVPGYDMLTSFDASSASS